MVKSITITKDHTTKCGLELKRGSEHSVYEGLYDELVNVAKVAQDTKPTKQIKKSEGDN